MSNRSALALWTIIRPRTERWPPKYSATIAPIRLSVEATLSAVKKYGSAFGMRTLRRTSPSLAAYERISSSDAGSTPDRPRVTLAMTGKNDRTAAIIIFDSGFSRPNQLLNSGANAMIGIAPAATASGSSDRARRRPARRREAPRRRPAVDADEEAADRLEERRLRRLRAAGTGSPFQFVDERRPGSRTAPAG